MADWRDKVEKIEGGIFAIHEAINRYLELTGNPDEIPVDDIVDLCQLTGILSPHLTRDEVIGTAMEFMVYSGHNLSKDEQFFRR